MASTGAKADRHWLANYYLRGLITVVAIGITLAAGSTDGTPLLVGAAVWIALWLAAKVREGYTDGTDHQP